MKQKHMEIRLKIENVTDDLDIRQSIWLEYLETDSEDIDSICNKLIIQKKIAEQIETNIIKLTKSKSSDDFLNILNSFTEFEQDIISLIVVGIPINSIAKYKMIKPMRIIQIISCISSNPVWREYFAEKELNTKRKIRFK